MWSRMLLVLICVSGGLAGCAKDSIQLTAENRSLLKSVPFYSVHDAPPYFYYVTRGEEVMAGLSMGLLSSVKQGFHDDLAGLYHLENPNRTIAQDLTRRVFKEYDLKDVRPNEFDGSWSEPEDLRRRFSQGLLLEVRTAQWGLRSTSWSKFHVILKSSARLISLQDAKEIWYDTCVSEKIDGGERDPTLEDLKAKDGEILKTMVKEATEICTAELWTKFQQLTSPR